MAGLAEGVQGVVAYSPYATGVITPNVENLAPPTANAQYLRRVSSSLNLKTAAYVSQEIRPDMQIADARHGTHNVTGDIMGEFSPGTYFDFFEAVHRDTRAAAITSSQTNFTSIATSNAGTITLGSGNPVTTGFQVGDLIRLTGTTGNAADNINFVITGFSGTNNEVIAVTPSPPTTAASTIFTMDGVGYSTKVPASGQVSRLWGIEIFHEDISVSRLFTEVRASKYSLKLPATGLAEVTLGFMGRDMVTNTTQYYSAANAVTTTTAFAAVNGQLLLNGTSVGVITGLDLTCDLKPTAADVVGQNFPGEIFLGRADITGQISAYLTDDSLFNDFVNETELQLLVQVASGYAANAPAVVIFLPAIKLNGADLALQGEAGQMITAPFQALRYQGTAPGVPSTTIRIVDTQAVAGVL